MVGDSGVPTSLRDQACSPTSTDIGSSPSSPTPHPGSCPASWPVWTCGTASTLGWRTGSGRRKPSGCGTSLQWLCSQQCLVGDRDDRDGPRCLVRTARLRGRTRPRQMRDRDIPVPGAARRRPDQPQRPATQAPHRPNLAVGRTDHPSLAPNPCRVHLNPGHPLSQRPESPTPASGTGANPTRQSSPQPTPETETTAPQAISTPGMCGNPG